MHFGIATFVQSFCFFFPLYSMVHVDIAIVFTVPQQNTLGWLRRTSRWPPAQSVIKAQYGASVPDWFISNLHWVVDFVFTVRVFPQVFDCECWIIPLNTFKIRIYERLRLKSSVRVQSSLAIMWTLVSLPSFILFVFRPLSLSLSLLCMSELCRVEMSHFQNISIKLGGRQTGGRLARQHFWRNPLTVSV